MEERKFIKLKKEEYGVKEYIKRDLGKGKISKLDIEYTPIGEKIIISTSKPGFVIGRKGEKIEDLTNVLKTRFKLENPHVEIKEIANPLFDAQTVADDIALDLERMGNLKFKVVAYKKLQEIMKAGALGCEIRTSGKLPSERAKSWRFGEGYLKKAGDSTKEVDKGKAVALTKTGIIGVKVAIMAPTARIYDKIYIDDALKAKIKPALKETREANQFSDSREFKPAMQSSDSLESEPHATKSKSKTKKTKKQKDKKEKI